MTSESTANQVFISGGFAEGETKAPMKRRRNRKKKPKKENAGNVIPGAEQLDQHPMDKRSLLQSSRLNHHSRIRERIVARGFSGEEIDVALDEMWNKQLAYDEYDAVLQYLEGRVEGAEEAQNYEKMGKTAPPCGGQGDQESYPCADHGTENNHNTCGDVRGEDNGEEMNMASKLDVVAGFENLTDAAFALTEWVIKAAKPDELEELCTAERTSALPTLFRRAIGEEAQNFRFDNAILPAMLRLVVSLVRKYTDISPEAVVEAGVAFESVLKLARKVVEEYPDESDLPDRVARFIVSRIALAGHESKCLASVSSSTVPTANEEYSASTGSVKILADCGTQEILRKLDLERVAAKRYSMAAQVAFQALGNTGAPQQNGNSIPISYGVAGTDLDPDRADIVVAILGAKRKLVLDRCRADLMNLKKKAKEGESERKNDLRIAVEEYKLERQIVGQRIAELRQSIENLEMYDAELCSKIVDIEGEIEEEGLFRAQEVGRLQSDLAEATRTVKFGSSVDGLIDLLKAYDDSLHNSLKGSMRGSLFLKATPDSTEEVAADKMGVYLFMVSNYFDTAAEALDLLRGRIESAEEEVLELKQVISECRRPVLASAVGDIDECLATKEECIVSDSAALDRLIREASDTFDVLVARIGQHAAIFGEGDHSLSVRHPNVLQSLHSCISKLGIIDGSRRLDDVVLPGVTRSAHCFVDYHPERSAAKGSYTPDSILDRMGSPSKVASSQSQAGTPVPKLLVHATSPVEQPSSTPRFTWAVLNNNASEEVGKKTSLIDIQKEEQMQSRSTSKE